MLTIGAESAFQYPRCPQLKKDDARQQAYNDYCVENDYLRRRVRNDPQGPRYVTTHKVAETEDINVHTSYTLPVKENSIGAGNIVNSTMSNVTTMNQGYTAEKSTVASFHQTIPRVSSDNVDTVNKTDYHERIPAINGSTTPQRPQDLIHTAVPVGVPKVNERSSAQYRKSYAFKIWKERGSFPYRLAEQPSTQERKISKKHLNAMKARQDRLNEEAWRTFKQCRGGIQQKNAQTPTHRFQRVGKDMSSSNQQFTRQSASCASQERKTKERTTINRNSIPDYFKTKKDSFQNGLTSSPVCKAIPTSVIYVNSAKSNQISKPAAPAEPEMTSESPRKIISNGNFEKSFVPTILPVANGMERNIFFSSEESTRGPINDLEDWCRGKEKTSSSDHSNFVRRPNNAGSLTEKDVEGCRENIAPSSQCIAPLIEPEIQHPQTQHQAGPSPAKADSPVDCLAKSSESFTSQSEKTSEQETGSTDEAAKNRERQLDNSDEVPRTSSCSDLGDATSERNNNRSPSHSANMVAIVKNSLSKKYCKENVMPESRVNNARSRKRKWPNVGGGQEGRGRTDKLVNAGKATVFTRLDETVASNLADGIHNVNSEYFPIDALAKKAARETSKHIDSAQGPQPEVSIKSKVEEIDRARLLLRELFDVTSESDEDHEMKTFDRASRSFGRRNILNHLSLLDRYFAELQKKLSNGVPSQSTSTEAV